MLALLLLLLLLLHLLLGVTGDSNGGNNSHDSSNCLDGCTPPALVRVLVLGEVRAAHQQHM